MNIYSKSAYWEWLYRPESCSLSEPLMSLLKSEGDYSKKRIESTFEGKPYHWYFETVGFHFPVNTHFSFYGQLALHDEGSYEENLFLKYNDDYYIIGWINSHSHNCVFRYEEYQRIIKAMDTNGVNQAILSNAAAIYLARYVGLTNETEVQHFMDVITPKYALLTNEKPSHQYQTKHIEPYNKKIMPHLSDGMVLKMKQVKHLAYPIGYTINEGAVWKTPGQGIYQLEGFAANSLRSKIYETGLKTPVDIYCVNTDMSNYSFPYEIWGQLMDGLLAGKA